MISSYTVSKLGPFYETRCISSCLLSAATEPYCLYRLNIVGYVLVVRQNSASNPNNVKIYMTFSVKKTPPTL